MIGRRIAHEQATAGTCDGVERTFFSFLANIVTGIGFALLLVAVSELFGGIANWRQGVFWGLAGFVVFTLAPASGFRPSSCNARGGSRRAPAVVARDGSRHGHGARALFYSRSLVAVLAAIALLVAPHVIGAPQPVSYESPIPEGLHHSFVVAVVMTALLFWVLLGGLAGMCAGVSSTPPDHGARKRGRGRRGHARPRRRPLRQEPLRRKPRHRAAAALGLYRDGGGPGRRDGRANRRASGRRAAGWQTIEAPHECTRRCVPRRRGPPCSSIA